MTTWRWELPSINTIATILKGDQRIKLNKMGYLERTHYQAMPQRRDGLRGNLNKIQAIGASPDTEP